MSWGTVTSHLKFVIGWKIDGSPRKETISEPLHSEYFLSSRADIYEKRVVLSQLSSDSDVPQGSRFVLQTWSSEITMMSPFSTDLLPLHRGALLALWCLHLILPYMGCSCSQNKVGRGFYSHWIAQGAAGFNEIREIRSGDIRNKKTKERKRHWDSGISGCLVYDFQIKRWSSNQWFDALGFHLWDIQCFSGRRDETKHPVLSGESWMESLALN